MDLRRPYTHILLILIISALQQTFVSAQQETDTTGIIEKIVEKLDTLVNNVIPDSTLKKWSEEPIDSMLLRNPNSRLQQEIFNLIVKSNSDSVKSPTVNTSFAAMDGRVIRNIYFRSVDMFSPVVTDTTYKPVSWFENIANKAHNDTRKSILERYLLFHEGDRLDVFLAAENERILRDLSFIMDARFIATPVRNNPDSIDLILITQDKFPIGIEAKLERSSVGVIGITHQNFLGYGYQLSATSYLDTENTPHLGYSLMYGTTNISGTFTSANFGYLKRWNQESFLLNFSREFRAISLENAGGFSFENTSHIQSIHLLDTIYELSEYRFSLTDLWIGRIVAPLGNQNQYTRSGLYMSARFSNYNGITSPEISDIYLYPFNDRIRALFSIGITRQGNRKDNLIYTFGRTEDVPFGYQFEVTTGYEWMLNKERPYMSFSTAYGSYLKNSAYLYSRLQYGTFFNKGSTEQGVIRFQSGYFSRLYKYNSFQIRNFVAMLLTLGINRFPGEYISISDRRGIEGLAGTALRGTDKVVLNLESVLFTPYELFGFRFAFFGGLDLGFIKREQEKFSDTRLFSGINAGVRIRNDQLVFNTFVIKFAFYPGRPDNSTAENFTIDQVPRTRFIDFLPDKPDLILFQ